jgi:hypothetical protein
LHPIRHRSIARLLSDVINHILNGLVPDIPTQIHAGPFLTLINVNECDRSVFKLRGILKDAALAVDGEISAITLYLITG